MEKRHKIGRGRESGYKLPPHARKEIRILSRTKLHRSVLAALGDHLVIAALAVLGIWAFCSLPFPYSLLTNLLVLLLIANRQRGLENLVHEAAHRNWTRGDALHDRWLLNDRLGDSLAALPLFSTVSGFRTNHAPHHVQFGSDFDRDKLRYEQLEIENLNQSRSVGLKFFYGLMTRILPYAKSWWVAIQTTNATTRKALVWHGLYITLVGATSALLIEEPSWLIPRLIPVWIVYWLIPMTVILTPVRFVAEADKHSYERTNTVFEATFTNQGLLERFLHPHHDGYHLIHHLFPSIPHHKLKRAHQYLLNNDPEFYGSLNRHRDTVLQKPHQTKRNKTR